MSAQPTGPGSPPGEYAVRAVRTAAARRTGHRPVSAAAASTSAARS